MIRSKKVFTFICAVVFLACFLVACNSQKKEQPQLEPPSGSLSSHTASQANNAKSIVRIGVLQGPSGLGMVKLMEDNENKEAQNIYEFTVAGTPDEISAKIISGELDIAAVPTNAASVLYNKTEHKVKLLAVNTLGVLYLLQKDEPDEESFSVASIQDLEGTTIYTTGQGATQEYVLNYLIQKNALDDVTVSYKSEHAELAAMMIEGSVNLALLPQPFVTTVMMKDETIKVALDITKEWENASGGTKLVMGAIIVRSDFLDKNVEAVDRFLEEYASSVDYVNANVVPASALSGKFEIIKEDVAQKAIPECNIVSITGADMKDSVKAYLDVLYSANPKSVGGSLPDDAFYYIQK